MRKHVIRAFLAVLLLGSKRRTSPKPATRSVDGVSILLTGTFYSQNWINAQLVPITLAANVRTVSFVSTTPVPEINGLCVIYPPKILQKIIGRVPARLLTFAWYGIRRRPDIVGGFHLLINGLMAQWVARMSGSRALYICVGGPTEVLGGGFATENRIFGRLKRPDKTIERKLLRAVDAFDFVVVRGRSAKTYFEQEGIQAPLHIITAGVDAEVFSPTGGVREFDLVFLARLSEVKRVDLFLQLVADLKECHDSTVRALVIGDGPVRASAENVIRQNRLTDNVRMTGQRDDVAALLNTAKIFVLTSRSEGLSQAMVQAMLCGLPAVVANVGSLSDLVVDGESGYLIDDHGRAAAYVGPVCTLLTDSNKLRDVAIAAREAALGCSTENISSKWNALVNY